MNIVMVQCDTVYNAVSANLERFEKLLERESGGDIIVFPELFATGFSADPSVIAESADGRILSWMKMQARQRQAAVAGSMAVEESGRYFNRFCFVCPDGSVVKYDKRHLFTVGGEADHYSPGDERVVAEYGGLRILLQVCYDLRFPVFSRSRDDYDMILYVANWPDSRIYAWDTLLRARAVENLCYVAGVNRVGSDCQCMYSGGTVLLDFMGKPVCRAEEGSECVLCGAVSQEKLVSYKNRFPVLDDRDNFVIL